MKNVKPGHEQPIAVLDPGHYGSKYNPGAVPGYFESEQMWKLTQYQKAAMEAYGIKVILTRTQKDQNPDLVKRGMMAAGADIFESLHSNACDTECVDRPEGIYLYDDDCGAIDAQSKEFAALMAQTVRDCMDTDDPAKIFCRLSGNDRDHDGKKNDDYYGVLYGCHQAGTAGCITEHSFHTNRAKAAWLMDDANLKKLAQAKADAYAKWFDLKKPASKPKVDYADSYNKAKKGTYQVKTNGGVLHLRSGASTDHPILEKLENGSKVQCYGYYTGGWLSVVAPSGKTGFVSEKWLKKV